jgi:hypothetical protein
LVTIAENMSLREEISKLLQRIAFLEEEEKEIKTNAKQEVDDQKKKRLYAKNEMITVVEALQKDKSKWKEEYLVTCRV